MKKDCLILPLIFLLLYSFSCHQSENIAAGGSHLFLTADPPQINANGSSNLFVTGTDSEGNPLPDGTVVSFSVDKAGRVSPSPVQLKNGNAESRYLATNFSGDVTITALSGGVSATATVNVADVLKKNVFVSADPTTLPTGGGTSLLSAVVTDDSGKTMDNIGVQFTTTAGVLQSGGRQVRTDENGVAKDVLNTTQGASITATTDDGYSGQAEVLVGVSLIVCHMSSSPLQPHVGDSVSFFDTSDDPNSQITGYHWDFGDLASADGKNVQHVYRSAGTFSVIHSVTDAQGNTIVCDPVPLEIKP